MVGLKNSIRNQSFKKSTWKPGKSVYGLEGESVFSIRYLKIQTVKRLIHLNKLKMKQKQIETKAKVQISMY